VFSILIPRNQGKYEVSKAEPPCLGRLSTSWRSPCITECAFIGRLTHCQSSHRHGTHTVGLGIVFKVYSCISAVFCTNKVTSRRVWLFTTPRRSWVERGYVFSYLPPLENSQVPASGQQYLSSVTRHPGCGPADFP
jgi:hypothetical protein